MDNYEKSLDTSYLDKQVWKDQQSTDLTFWLFGSKASVIVIQKYKHWWYETIFYRVHCKSKALGYIFHSGQDWGELDWCLGLTINRRRANIVEVALNSIVNLRVHTYFQHIGNWKHNISSFFRWDSFIVITRFNSCYAHNRSISRLHFSFVVSTVVLNSCC